MTDVVRIIDHVVERKGRAARYAALFACVGLAGMGPSEAIGLRGDDLELPAHGRGGPT